MCRFFSFIKVLFIDFGVKVIPKNLYTKFQDCCCYIADNVFYDIRRENMKKLPIRLQDFETLRRENMLCVDKTKRLLELVTKGRE